LNIVAKKGIIIGFTSENIFYFTIFVHFKKDYTMKTRKLYCIGHITLDKVVTPRQTVYMPGGTAFYFSKAINNFDDIDFSLLTAVGEPEMHEVDKLRSTGIDVSVMPSRHSVCFENIYGENQDNRTQRVSAKADPFTMDYLKDIEASYILLGSLLADDFSLDVLKYLSKKSLIAIDVQGYLREVRDGKVYAVDWKDKSEALKYIHVLKANEHEMEVLTGFSDVKKAAGQLYDWGVKEALITLGSLGSVIYDGNTYYRIPAYKPKETVDATGCGDTYVTGYLYRRAKGDDIEKAGRFAAAMSTLKLERSGPFNGSKEDVFHCMQTAGQRLPVL
jgi:sugar/nucleoside kinase (ribokinase family)